MADKKWTLKFVIFRKKGENHHYDTYTLEISPEEYVIDGIERIWAFHDRSLAFAHACHHSTCGACGMRVNDVEKLTCITKIRDVTTNGGSLKIEPLRNFPIVGDLVVDMTRMYADMDRVHAQAVHPLSAAPLEGEGISPLQDAPRDNDGNEYLRLADCIECGLCLSACPTAGTAGNYLGPMVLAAAQFQGLKNNPDLLHQVDCVEGAWRCHNAYECSAVCPSNVNPGWRIMDLRRQVIGERIRRWFTPKRAI